MENELTTNLTVADLKVIASLIEACNHRGAFKVNELTTVGDLYNKIVACLQTIKEPEKEQTPSS
jgi:hypothetical protein